jgi:UPF0271 protein
VKVKCLRVRRAVAGKRRVFVFDASGFITGLDSLLHEGEIYTTPEVAGELKEAEVKKRCETALSLGRVKIESPEPEHLKAAREAAASTGDLFKLSKADLSILALAVMLKDRGFSPTLISEDYAVQNVAEHSTVGRIRLEVKWAVYCPSCGRSFQPGSELRVCPVCGEKLKRKAWKRRRLKEEN